MKYFVMIFIGFFSASLTYGQTLKIQAGTSISKLDWELDKINLKPPYKETLVGLSIFAGIDYLDRKYFNLSSNIGFLNRGGKGEIPITDSTGTLTDQFVISKPTLNYLSINTVISLKYPIKESLFPFFNIGPRVDILTSYSEHFDGIKDINELNMVSFGLVTGVGLKYYFSKFHLGLCCDYYLDFNKVAVWPIRNGISGGQINVNTITTVVTFGYNLE